MIKENETHVLSALPLPVSLSEVLLAGFSEERFNVFSHLAGAFLNSIVAFALAARALEKSQPAPAFGLAAFGLCMTVGYIASVFYHAAQGDARPRFRRWDRASIYVAIAGFHTANIMIGIPFAVRFPLLVAVWGMTLFFSLREVRAPESYQRNSVLPYVLLAWGGLLSWKFLAQAVTSGELAWVIASSLAYMIGVVVVRCGFIPKNHEIWHVLVLAGNACAFASWVHGVG